jgi:predicted RNase H-like nuclease
VNKKVFFGVDGCRGGWFAVFLTAEKDQNCELFFGQAFL